MSDDLFKTNNNDLELKRLRKEQNRLNKEVDDIRKVMETLSTRINRLSHLLSDGSGK